MQDPGNLNIGPYHLIRAIGQGGMSVVVLATDTRDGRHVAVKVLSTQAYLSDEVKLRFRKEARALAQLTHPNIVRLLDYDEIDSRPCLILEWVGGGTLSERMGKPLPYREAANLLLPIAHALAYAHQQGIIHRDVKPSNILLTEAGEPRLTDFGIAKLSVYQPAPDLTEPGVQLGTPEYMAPEQALGQPVGPQTDVYSLGVVLYELITGRKPYKADTPFGTMLQHSTQPLPPASNTVPDLPIEIERVLYKAMAKDPTARYQTMAEFAVVLEKLSLGRALSSTEAPRIPKAFSAGPFLSTVGQWLRTPLPGLRFLPAWVPVVVLTGALFLAALWPRLQAVPAFAPDQLAKLSFIQGEVQISDGSTTSAARRGALVASSVTTRLKTGQGYAHVELRDGAFIILDTGSAIEFTPPNHSDAGNPIAFNLAYGRVLVVNNQDSPHPTRVQLGGKVTATAFRAVMGLDIQPESSALQQVDCLVGQCQVETGSGTMDLGAGQSAHVSLGGRIELAGGILYDAWAAIGGLAVPSPTSSGLLVHILPTVTDLVNSTGSASATKAIFPITAGNTLSPSPSITRGSSGVTPSPSGTGRTPAARMATQTPPPPSGNNPVPTSTPTSTLTRSVTPSRTWTLIPTLTSSVVPSLTWTPVPTLTQIPTATPGPTDTLSPSATALPTSTAEPSLTPAPTDSTAPPAPTNTHVVPTKKWTPVPTDTAQPSPTSP